MKSVCAFTSVCEEDAEHVGRYVEEVDRLRVPVAVHYDRCSDAFREATNERLRERGLLAGWTACHDRTVEFDETHKQTVFDLVADQKFDWALAWDVDETFCKDAPEILPDLLALDCDLVNVRWVNLWETPDRVRVDGPFGSGRRDRLYNLRSGRWEWTNKITNGPKLLDRKGHPVGKRATREVRRYDLAVIHWGMMTRQLRELHKERWDRIYSTALRGDPNPYGFWSYALDEATYPPVTKANPWT